MPTPTPAGDYNPLDDVPNTVQTKNKRQADLDDVPQTIKKARIDYQTLLAENETMCYIFAAERSEGRTAKVIKKGRGEINPRTITSGLAPDKAKRHQQNMQDALESEWHTWTRYDAVTIISPQRARSIPADKQITARAVWTNKGADLEDEIALKCRIVGRGFQERYDEKLRRDSPTCTPMMVNILCSSAASLKLHLMAADAKGAFLQGKKIDREL